MATTVVFDPKTVTQDDTCHIGNALLQVVHDGELHEAKVEVRSFWSEDGTVAVTLEGETLLATAGVRDPLFRLWRTPGFTLELHDTNTDPEAAARIGATTLLALLGA